MIKVGDIKNYKFILLGIILVIGLMLRFHNINTWPRLGATFDEYAWTWLGMNLIQKGTPESWSPHEFYDDKKVIIYQKAYFTLVKPYLEHPPVFGIVAGSYALLSGVIDMYDLHIQDIRGLALILGAFSILMVYVFASELFGARIGLLSSLIYATIPTVVVGSRLVQNENFFIPFFLLSLYFTSRYLRTDNSLFRNLAAIISGILILSKIPWFAGAASIVIIFLFLKRYSDIYKFLAIVIPIFLTFFVYGFYYNWSLFIELWVFQLQRYDLYYNSFFALFTHPYLADRFLIDGWIYIGWISIFFLFLRDIKKYYLLIFPFLAYLGIFIFAIPNEAAHGWYRYPFYPFFAISIALFLREYFNKNNLITFIILLFTGLSMLQLSFGYKFGFSFVVFRLFLFLISLSMLPLFFPKTRKITDIISFLCLVGIFFLNAWAIKNYNEQ